MSVYEEICEWIVEDYLDQMDAGESPDLDAIMEQNLIDLSESIYDRREDIRCEIEKRMKEVEQ